MLDTPLGPATPRSSAAATHWWTAADGAELDVLVHELARSYFEHRERCPACRPGDCPELVAWREHLDECPACRGDAPLTFGPPCPRRREFIAHGSACTMGPLNQVPACHSIARCNPCPALRTAIEAVLVWREAPELLSRAEFLRAEREAA
ncbi:MAG: hypothetical protein H0U82_07785 [Actinobacteria bacterium]|nr:hypothetical protein [Actinomycetota bacterium]